MLKPAEKSRLKALFGQRILFDQALTDYTSFKVGGLASIVYLPLTVEDLQRAAAELCPRYNYYILGFGTNTLFSDQGFDGVVFCLKQSFKEIKLIEEKDDKILLSVGSGCALKDLYQYALDQQFSGLEWAYGVPGSIGGALRMNAGTFLGKVSDILCQISGLDQNFKVKTWAREKIYFAYRKNSLAENIIFTNALFSLKRDKQQQILQRVEPLKKRKDLQPLNKATAGSTFKNPEGQSAAALIEKAGLKGLTVGDAEVSQEHANFIINRGQATAADIFQLIKKVKKKVAKKTGVILEEEVKLVGRGGNG